MGNALTQIVSLHNSKPKEVCIPSTLNSVALVNYVLITRWAHAWSLCLDWKLYMPCLPKVAGGYGVGNVWWAFLPAGYESLASTVQIWLHSKEAYTPTAQAVTALPCSRHVFGFLSFFLQSMYALFTLPHRWAMCFDAAMRTADVGTCRSDKDIGSQ